MNRVPPLATVTPLFPHRDVCDVCGTHVVPVRYGLPSRGMFEAPHLRALMLHASLTAFTVTLPVSLRYLDDAGEGSGNRPLDDALALIDAEIDRLGRPPA